MRLPRVRLTALLAAVALAACASQPTRYAQWTSPTLGAQSKLMQGTKVLVACEFYDATVRQLCQDELSREVRARGAEPVTAPAGTVLLLDREPDGQLLSVAASSGASTVMVMSLTPTAPETGSGLSVGIGGFSFGRGGGLGVGLSAPIGGTTSGGGLASNGRVTDVRTGQLVWTVSVVAAGSADLSAQLGTLARGTLDAARDAGLF